MDAGVNCKGIGVDNKNDGMPGVMPTDRRPGTAEDEGAREEWPPRCNFGGANTLEPRAVEPAAALGPTLENDAL
jgi:hypothetical protein